MCVCVCVWVRERERFPLLLLNSIHIYIKKKVRPVEIGEKRCHYFPYAFLPFPPPPQIFFAFMVSREWWWRLVGVEIFTKEFPWGKKKKRGGIKTFSWRMKEKMFWELSNEVDQISKSKNRCEADNNNKNPYPPKRKIILTLWRLWMSNFLWEKKKDDYWLSSGTQASIITTDNHRYKNI